MHLVFLSILAGIGGTGFGGLLTVALGKRSPAVIAYLLSFAGGIMTSIVCFSLVPEAMNISNIWVTILGLTLGIIVVMGLNRHVDRLTGVEEEQMNIHYTHQDLYHETHLIDNSNSLLRSGIIMLTVIGLHNIPEGIAIGAGGSHNPQFGIMLAVIIAFHNIPEGMAIAAPLLGGGMKKLKIILLTALSGAPTLLGCLLGILFGNLSDTAIALSLAVAGGAMLYVVFGEIIPQSIILTKNRIATIVTLFGIIMGLVIAQI
jgi:ZIP family zinc transporter